MQNFEPTAIAKQMIDFQKNTFNQVYDVMATLAGHTEQIGTSLYNENSLLPDEGKKVINEWIAVCKNSRNEFKKAIDGSFEKLNTLFAETTKGK